MELLFLRLFLQLCLRLNACEKYFGIKPLIVGPGIKTGLNIKYENPREVGADRIVNAVAGIHEFGSPLIIVDFGTATTYCYINEDKQYMGGAIAPGIDISTEALYSKHQNFQELKLPSRRYYWEKYGFGYAVRYFIWVCRASRRNCISN